MKRAGEAVTPRLWWMNADCEAELAAWPAPYRRIPTIARRNRALAPSLVWLAARGDALAIEEPWERSLQARAGDRGVLLVAPGTILESTGIRFEPWGWTGAAVAEGEKWNVVVDAPPVEVVRSVSSKLFSHEIEREMGIVLEGARVADSMELLAAAAQAACPGQDDKWVIKGPFGFAARERVLGRGPVVDERAGIWAARQFARGFSLLFEPWIEVVREYGVPIVVGRDGTVHIVGFSDLQTNGAGAALGYRLDRPVEPEVASVLTRVALDVGKRLHAAGYFGPAGIDALEHRGGLRPLVEVNARWTMGHVAVAVARDDPSRTYFRPGREN